MKSETKMSSREVMQAQLKQRENIGRRFVLGSTSRKWRSKTRFEQCRMKDLKDLLLNKEMVDMAYIYRSQSDTLSHKLELITNRARSHYQTH